MAWAVGCPVEQILLLQPAVQLCVPTLFASCDRAIFVDQATDASRSSDAVVLKGDQFG
jgi:hypothetical protein